MRLAFASAQVPRELPQRALLKGVSRSFYLSLRALPGETRYTVALAYLLARATDTVADTRLVPASERLRLLAGLGARIAGQDSARPLLAELARLEPEGPGEARGSAAERTLLRELPGCLILLDDLPELERGLVRQVLATIVAGQRSDLERFPAGGLASLETREELFTYCYQVAGCVGEFWSELHLRRLPALAGLGSAWVDEGRAFGRALQLTNVLRDLPGDLAEGRCYLPREELAELGLSPQDLLDPSAGPRLRPLLLSLVAQARSDCAAGLRHTLAIPRRAGGLRLAGILPLLLALETLGLIAASEPLDPHGKRKVSRQRVYALLAGATLGVHSDRGLGALFARVERQAFPHPLAGGSLAP